MTMLTKAEIDAKIADYEKRLAGYVRSLGEVSPDLVYRLCRDIRELRRMAMEAKE